MQSPPSTLHATKLYPLTCHQIPIIRRSPHERQPSRAVEVRDAQSYIVNPKHGAPITGQIMSTMHHVAFQKKATQAHCFNYATSSFSPAQSSKSNSLAIADLLQHDPALHQLSLSHEKSPSLKEHYTQSSINSVPLTSCVDSFHSNLSSVSTVQNATTTKYTDSFENKELSGPSLNSMDDPDVRLAAEALEDLRAGMKLIDRSGPNSTDRF
ncbi:BgtAc-30228 [Blumeria graminis f. sp. tritici]|uniref:BgtAc-30228 n=2 Tax=Blumeria graminis f. sp. tritici TaxID=62690 RepID=A0A9X9PS71_BLUGR|nr:hypothetical protein BGT96224_Ac30228 [Blumeria graminis f. sp. tritici 96224]VCU40538.1 BgtAc-30228 [Blumeria graminis f. sp. tritici]